MKSLASILAGVALVTAASPLVAQDQESETEAAGPVLPEGNTLEEVQQREAANAEQAQAAKQQNDANAANEAAYLKAQAEYEAALARIEQEKAAREVEVARSQAEHEAAMAKWEADVAACKAGDFSRCDPRQTPGATPEE